MNFLPEEIENIIIGYTYEMTVLDIMDEMKELCLAQQETGKINPYYASNKK